MTEDRVLPFDSSIEHHIEDEMKRSYLDYAMSVIVGRALPDVRDGLKPVHRRVLYGMWESGNLANRPYKKSARIVGDVMGKYHPHGDAPIYDSVVRMAQSFSMRYRLVDGQGNFGSIDGDSPAAMRYTEVRMTQLAQELLREDIDKETVGWTLNYDGSLAEPLVLPARMPNLLMNGAAGIAVGMATNIPPHNLGEVLDAVELLLDEAETPLKKLMAKLPGPDFPTAGFIHGRQGIRDAYQSGRGTIQLRARAAIESQPRGDRQSIVITELPFQVNKARLMEKIADLVRDKRIEGISDLRDESDRDGIRVVVDLKRAEVPEIVLNQLYKMTPMQTSYGIILLAIVDNQPQVLSLKQILQHFIDHRRAVIVRRTRFDLKKAEERAHILEGILKALDQLDEIIATIRASQTPPEARDRLMQDFSLTQPQAQAILDMRLQKLTGLEREKVIEEYRELSLTIEKLRAILASDELVVEEIRKEITEIRDSYADPRRTEIVDEVQDITVEDLIADEDMVITVSQAGYVKRSPLSLYRAQNRGGKGRKGMEAKDGDWVEQVHVASAHSYLLVFTESGRVHWLKVYDIPQMGPAARGKAIVNLLSLDSDERLAATLSVRDFNSEVELVFATQNGTVKKTSLEAYSRPRAGGIIGINIDDDDRLLAVQPAEPGDSVFLATAKGFAIRFEESDVRSMGRATRGVRGISLRKGDKVVSMEVLRPKGEIFTVAARGMGKRTDLAAYRVQRRGGKGIINLKVSDRTGPVIGSRQVLPDEGVLLITQAGKIIRTGVTDVRVIGRSTQGVKLMELADEDLLVAMAKLQEQAPEKLTEPVEPAAESSSDSAE